mmetsp:Transcript_23462/g.44191  ORF Transcript_23462/g.44191 Transcript_23462/m.44191 type:complete len:298 (-) Transcript_23462:44-937(-)
MLSNSSTSSGASSLPTFSPVVSSLRCGSFASLGGGGLSGRSGASETASTLGPLGLDSMSWLAFDASFFVAGVLPITLLAFLRPPRRDGTDACAALDSLSSWKYGSRSAWKIASSTSLYTCCCRSSQQLGGLSKTVLQSFFNSTGLPSSSGEPSSSSRVSKRSPSTTNSSVARMAMGARRLPRQSLSAGASNSKPDSRGATSLAEDTSFMRLQISAFKSVIMYPCTRLTMAESVNRRTSRRTAGDSEDQNRLTASASTSLEGMARRSAISRLTRRRMASRGVRSASMDSDWSRVRPLT